MVPRALTTPLKSITNPKGDLDDETCCSQAETISAPSGIRLGNDTNITTLSTSFIPMARAGSACLPAHSPPGSISETRTWLQLWLERNSHAARLCGTPRARVHRRADPIGTYQTPITHAVGAGQGGESAGYRKRSMRICGYTPMAIAPASGSGSNLPTT